MNNMTDKTWSDKKETAQELPVENADAKGKKKKEKKEKKKKRRWIRQRRKR